MPRKTDPRDIFLSPTWRLYDVLGAHFVYADGIPNWFDGAENDPRLRNGETLFLHGIDVVQRYVGPVSVSYGFITPETSRRTVTYQDPDKPSHHRWDLGAAVDFVAHEWSNPFWEPQPMGDGEHDSLRGAPIRLAHQLRGLGIPYSRLITYSESPFLCLALSDEEVKAGRPRYAFYENRYQGAPGRQPQYIRMSGPKAAQAALEALQARGLPHPWRGSGRPTYHAGGKRRLQHVFTGPYSTALDWLINERSLRYGERNLPPVGGPRFERVRDAFYVVSHAYAAVVRAWGFRIPIDKGYLMPSHPDSTPEHAWEGDTLAFEVAAPDGISIDELQASAEQHLRPYGAVKTSITTRGVKVVVHRHMLRHFDGAA